MAKASEQFRQSDVTLWGIVALVCGALAVFGANVSALLPQRIVAALHQPRLSGPTLEALRLQVADLRDESRKLRNDNDQLLSRFSIGEQAATETRRRVGALEVTVPKLVEALPDDAAIDRSSLTASIGTTESGDRFDAEGGSVVVRRTPMPGTTPSQPLPAPVDGIGDPASGFGVALGEAVGTEDAADYWDELTAKFGPLLIGMAPRLGDASDGSGTHLIAGPIGDAEEAQALCDRLAKVSIACQPMPYRGTELPSAGVESGEGG